MPAHRVVVVGAGIGGLVAALELAVRGVDVVVIERAATPGGKMREVAVGGLNVDAGPTVFTMRWVLDEILADAGTSLDEQVTLRPLEVLARHAWDADARLDLFADRARSTDAIGKFSGLADARGFIAFCARARDIYATLEQPFLRASRGGPLTLVRRTGLSRLAALWRIAPFATLWGALGEHFKDPRLRQLFGRYATYCGSSPFLSPATLMLIAHVEQEGVWSVDGGMARIADALARVAAARGATFRFCTAVAEVQTVGGRASGVLLADGERIAADAVVVNADVGAVTGGHLGVRIARAIPAAPISSRSLSAVTWAMRAATRGHPLSRHNVFFGGDYTEEFDAIFRRGMLPAAPTVYVCAQDRGDREGPLHDGERLLCLINAPADGDRRDGKYGDTHTGHSMEIEQCEERTFSLLTRCGLQIQRQSGNTIVTTPAEFARLFPATGGALYGRASHGWRASFQRPGARTRIPGLYLAGGSTHPGPGVPMAALSGRMAAATLLADLPSTHRSRPAATPGGTSMHCRTTDGTA
jgi:1-hydroxycarotenoid 3,4-desaturase